MRYIQVVLLVMCNLYVTLAHAQYRTQDEIDSIGDAFVRQMQRNGQFETSKFSMTVKSSELLSGINLISESNEKFYIYNLAGAKTSCKSKGFFIVSCDKSLPSIIGYSCKSTFDKDSIPPALRYWLSTFCYDGKNSEQHNSELLSENATREVEPLLGDIKWGQGTPFNNECPTNGSKRCLTGCVATAMAQVMKYYEYPNCGTGKIKYTTNTDKITVEKDLSEFPFAWSNMTNEYSGDYTDEEASAVATLMSCCGASVSMDYGVEASGAYQYDILNAYLNNFGYDKDAAFMMRDYCSERDWHTLLMKELDAGHPVNYAGQSNKDGGHSFVIDGYRSSESTVYPYYHINWGWQGQCDGYYQIAELRPNMDGKYSTENGFNETQQMLIGVKPEDNISEGRNVICTSELQPERSELYSGEEAKIDIANIYNFSLDTFDGELFAVLVDSSNVEMQIGSLSTSIPFMSSVINQNIHINIPDSTATGNYTLELRSIRDGSKVESKVYSSSYPNIRILHTSTSEFSSKLGAVELEATKEATDDKQICINAYVITNRTEETFNGQLQMAITDKEYNLLAQFGSSEVLSDFEYLDFLSDPISFYGYLPEDISNGEYFLCLVSKHINEEKWELVCYYDDSMEDTNEQILSLPISIANEIVTIGKQTYRKGSSTSIRKTSYFPYINIVGDGIIVSSISKPQFITIYDYMGRVVVKKNMLPNKQAQIYLPRGCYVISIGDENIKIAL